MTKLETVSIRQVMELADKAHSHFFDADTMRFFKSRASETAYKFGKVIYFITSERRETQPRMWTVRKCDMKGDINTVGEFQAHENLREARKYLMCVIEGLKI